MWQKQGTSSTDFVEMLSLAGTNSTPIRSKQCVPGSYPRLLPCQWHLVPKRTSPRAEPSGRLLASAEPEGADSRREDLLITTACGLARCLNRELGGATNLVGKRHVTARLPRSDRLSARSRMNMAVNPRYRADHTARRVCAGRVLARPRPARAIL